MTRTSTVALALTASPRRYFFGDFGGVGFDGDTEGLEEGRRTPKVLLWSIRWIGRWAGGDGGGVLGSLAMSDCDPVADDEKRAEKASVVVYTLAQDDTSTKAAERIVALGQERLKSIQAAGVNLDGRTAQVAALELAAAAFTAGIAAAKDTGSVASWLAAVSSFLFVAGACTALWAIHSCKTQSAGIEPVWWSGALDAEEFNDHVSLSWAAKETQRSIDSALEVDARRGQLLNKSILLSVVGGAAAFAAAAVGVYLKPPL